MSKLTTAEQVKLLLNGTTLPWLREAVVVPLVADESAYDADELADGPSTTGAFVFAVEIWPVLRTPENESLVNRRARRVRRWTVGGVAHFYGTRDEPPDQEYVEVGDYGSLANAVIAAASDLVRQEVLQAWEAQIEEDPNGSEP